jgi:hypothetical protein
MKGKAKLRFLAIAVTLAMVFTLAMPLSASAAGETTWTAPTQAMKSNPNVARVGAHSAASTAVHYLGGDLVTMRASEFASITGAATPDAKLAAATNYQALGIFGSSVNDSPDPYWWNYFYNVYVEANGGGTPAPASDVVLLYPAGSPAQADVTVSEAYGGTSATLSIRPDVLYGIDPVAGVSYDDLIADLPENKNATTADDYDPPQVSNGMATLYTMSDSLKELAQAMKAAGKTGRYGDPEAIAQKYENYLKGMQYYILSKIADGTVAKKTFVLIDPNQAAGGLYQAYDISMGSGTAATVRGNEFLLHTATNLLDSLPAQVDGANKYLTAAQLVEADYIVASRINGTSGGKTADAIKADLVAAGVAEADIPPIFATAPNTTFTIAANSCENFFGIPAVNGFLYPEIVNPMTDTMYLMKNFWHINNSGTLNSLANNAFENASLPEGYSYSPTDFNESATQAKVNAGLAYYSKNKAQIDKAYPQLQMSVNSGWVKSGSTWKYYVNNIALTGWQKISNKWFYLDSAKSGEMATGWKKVGTKWYYLNPASGSNQGVMLTGWKKVGTKWYYLGANGDMKTGWLQDGGKWYYLGSASDGAMKTGTVKIGAKNYTFNKSGVWVK